MRRIFGRRERLLGARAVVRRSAFFRQYRWLVGLAAVGLVHDLIASHARDFGPSSLFHSPWFGNSAAAMVGAFVAAVSVLAAREQRVADQAPYLAADRGPTAESEQGLSAADRGDRYWYVDVSNTGRGMAIIENVTYDVEVMGDPAGLRSGLDFKGLSQVLLPLEADGRDEISLYNWQPGKPLADKDNVRLWEFSLRFARQLARLDAHVQYASVLGEAWRFDISLVPPHGFPPAPAS